MWGPVGRPAPPATGCRHGMGAACEGWSPAAWVPWAPRSGPWTEAQRAVSRWPRQELRRASAQSGLRSVPRAPGRWVRDARFARRPAGSCASGAAGSAGFFDGRKAPGARTEPPPHFAHGKAGLRGASAGAALKPLETCPWLSRRDSSSDEDSKPCGAKRAGGGPRPARPCAVSARRTHGDGRAGPRPGGGRRGRGPGGHSQAGGPRGEDALSSRTVRGPRHLTRGRPSAALSRSQFRSPTADRGLDTCDGTFQK